MQFEIPRQRLPLFRLAWRPGFSLISIRALHSLSHDLLRHHQNGLLEMSEAVQVNDACDAQCQKEE